MTLVYGAKRIYLCFVLVLGLVFSTISHINSNILHILTSAIIPESDVRTGNLMNLHGWREINTRVKLLLLEVSESLF